MTEKLASITMDGAIIMGNLFCADGHSYGKKFFAFSHMHSDHSEKLPKCLYNGKVFMTKPTRDLLEAIHDENYGSDTTNYIKKTQITTLDYNSPKMVGGKDGVKEKITFYESKHVLGASQIEIVTQNGEKILYSGDISSRDEPPHGVHTLIVDSTHGHPQYQKYSEPESLERRFLDKIVEIIDTKTQPIVIHAHRGKLQEIMSLISNHKELNEYSLHSSKTNIRIANAYKKYDFFIRDQIFDENTDESEKERDKDFPFIQFVSTFHKKSYEMNGNAYSINLADHPTNQFKEDENMSIFATTSHADFNDLINYVEKSNPENVIVDSYRTKQAPTLAKKLQEKGFNVEAQPNTHDAKI